jgi:hypothetical protein
MSELGRAILTWIFPHWRGESAKNGAVFDGFGRIEGGKIPVADF